MQILKLQSYLNLNVLTEFKFHVLSDALDSKNDELNFYLKDNVNKKIDLLKKINSVIQTHMNFL